MLRWWSVVECVYGEGSLRYARSLVEGFLRKKGLKYRVRESGRIIVYRIGFLSRLVLTYNFSDKSFTVCGRSDLIRELARRSGLEVGRPGEHVEELDEDHRLVYDLLVKRQTYQAIVADSRRSLIESLVFAIIVFALTYYLWGPLLGVYSTLFFLAFILMLPRINWWSEGKRMYIPVLYAKYRATLTGIDKRLREAARKLPSNDPLRRIAESQVKRGSPPGNRGEEG